jgi:hypothetical protein
MYNFINKEFTYVFKSPSVLYLRFARKTFKRRFPTSKVSASNITLGREQHGAHEPWAERACFTHLEQGA